MLRFSWWHRRGCCIYFFLSIFIFGSHLEGVRLGHPPRPALRLGVGFWCPHYNVATAGFGPTAGFRTGSRIVHQCRKEGWTRRLRRCCSLGGRLLWYSLDNLWLKGWLRWHLLRMLRFSWWHRRGCCIYFFLSIFIFGSHLEGVRLGHPPRPALRLGVGFWCPHYNVATAGFGPTAGFRTGSRIVHQCRKEGWTRRFSGRR